jgi:ABC-type polysaccharide/polyol phosphate export permease
MIAKLVELFRYRELVWNLVLRDLKARYKNSVLGFLWSLLNPLLTMVVFTVVFTFMMPNTEIQKFPVFLLCALLPWNFFQAALTGCVNSIVDHASLIKKVYFPREALPISGVLSNFVNFLLALVVLFAMLFAFRVPLTRQALWLPVIMAIQVIFTLGLGLILATINVFYRDTSVILGVVLQAWFFLTPIIYPIERLPTQSHVLGLNLNVHRLSYILNPMASIVSSYRVVLYNGAPPALDFMFRTLVTSVAMLAVGYLFFSHYSGTFGEEV